MPTLDPIPEVERGVHFRWFAILVAVAALSTFARVANQRTMHVPGVDGWVTADPDSHHQLHRVEGLLEHGAPPAERDPGLNFPDGASIPGAPYHPLILWAALAPFAPSDAETRHTWLEMCACCSATFFGVLTSLVAAWIGRKLAGDLGGLFAGIGHALCPASIGYSNVGNADYRAFVTFMASLIFALVIAASKSGSIERGAHAAKRGAMIGALAGIALGAWPATTMYIAQLDLVLALLILVGIRRELAGLARFGFALHAAAFVAVFPAVAASPWQAERPWIVINLSWFHLAFLALGALVFAPLFFVAHGSRAKALHPWLVAALLLALGAWIAFGESGPALGVREGFAWVTRSDAFMAVVRESQPLFGARALLNPFTYLGWALALLAPAWIAALVALIRSRRLELLPLVVCVPILFAQAATQSRFADALSAPMFALIAASAAPIFANCGRLSGLALAVLAPLGLEWEGAASSVRRSLADPNVERESPERRGARECCEWLRKSAPHDDRHSVLAMWTWGHTLQWAAERPIVASNYGAYVGEESFRDPSRFFLAQDFASAEPILERRRSRWILATDDLAEDFEMMCGAVEAHGEASLPRLPNDASHHDGRIWFTSVGMRLLLNGVLPPSVAPRDRPFDRLRLVHVAPIRDPKKTLRETGEKLPAAWVWEYVPGAVLEAKGASGDELAVDLELEYPAANWKLSFVDRIAAGADGIARLRIPYSTEATNGDAHVAPNARWRFGAKSGVLSVDERSVENGATIEIR